MEGMFPKDKPSSFKNLLLELKENFVKINKCQELLFENGTFSISILDNKYIKGSIRDQEDTKFVLTKLSFLKKKIQRKIPITWPKLLLLHSVFCKPLFFIESTYIISKKKKCGRGSQGCNV